jgi:mono/diheme cytochrome c family protein
MRGLRNLDRRRNPTRLGSTVPAPRLAWRINFMGRTSLLLTSLGLFSAVLSTQVSAEDTKPDPARLEFFESKVRPILANHCLGCHGPGKQKAGLRLDSRSAMMRGNDAGPVIQPGDPGESRLIHAIQYDGEAQMPPKGKLSDSEIAALTQWIKMGAVWPDATVETRTLPKTNSERTISDDDRAYWAFQPLKDAPPPHVRDASWLRSTLDQFILARLEEKGMKPVEPADKQSLIRRATFDLIGLPPTEQEIEAFLNDSLPEAFARVVDRLLASPHYGERWGRHWLDVARFGEDQAHTFEARKYPYGYRYRDWVVKALNDDMPYDRFVQEQIAGDLLDGPDREGRLAALGFFALGPVYYGKAVFDELDDRVDTLSRGFLGLTVACARCHDHKFDPIPQQDYYSLAGIFASTDYKEYPNAPAEAVAKFDQAQAGVKAKNDEIAEFLKTEATRWTESKSSEIARYMVAAWTLQNVRKSRPDLTANAFSAENKLVPFVLDRWITYLYPQAENRRPYLEGWRRVIEAQDRAVDLSANEAAKAEVAREAAALQERVLAVMQRRDAIAKSGPEADLLREVVSAQGLFALPKNEVERQIPEASIAKLKTLRADVKKLTKALPQLPVIHGLTEGSSIANMKVHLRGNPTTLGDEAPRRFLAVLARSDARAFTQGSGRLELARDVASPDNPLTARVMVNRIWEHHFGRGIVATPSNFGKMGERPSHPELLDHLARRFIALGWSMKALHREIMLSSTYQLSAQIDPRNHEIDPDNRLLWRANRRRLEVEAWRDAMLAVTGSLDRTLGGRSIPLDSPTNTRRTVYSSISRHDLDGLLRLFDFPDPNLTCDRRVVTTVPLQQLFVLNSEFMARQARALSSRLTRDATEPDASRVGRAFLLLYGRPATEREVQVATEFLAGHDEPSGQPVRNRLTRWEQFAQVLLAANEFLYVD